MIFVVLENINQCSFLSKAPYHNLPINDMFSIFKDNGKEVPKNEAPPFLTEYEKKWYFLMGYCFHFSR